MQTLRLSPIRKNKNTEIETKIHEQKEQGNAYFDEEALIQYLKQNQINIEMRSEVELQRKQYTESYQGIQRECLPLSPEDYG